MKIRYLILFILIPFISVASEKFKLKDFSMQLEQITSDPAHVWVSSGFTTVNPEYHTVMGVNEFYSPPFAAKNFRFKLSFIADERKIQDVGSYGKGDVGLVYAGGIWFPDKIIRYGTYHHLKNGKLISLGVTSELIPLFGQAGFMVKISIKNRATTPVMIKIDPELTPGNPDVIPLNNWGFSPPGSNTTKAENYKPDRWANESANIGLYSENETRLIAPGELEVSSYIVIINKKDKELPDLVNSEELELQTHQAWEKRLETYTKNVPSLTTDIEGLENYYKRSIITGLLGIYENPAYELNPVFLTSGMDGGGFCTYVWDNAGYIPRMVTLILDEKVRSFAKKMVEIDLEEHYAFSLDGTGIGVKYSYSPWSFTCLVSTIFKFLAPDKELFEYNRTLILNNEKRKSKNNLIDYGLQHNMLEMRGTGWEHFVVSPNAERSWSLRQLAEMGRSVGVKQSELDDWNNQANNIISSIQKNLWDEKAQWFASEYPDGFRDYVYSIQVYDALRADACTPAMEKVLLSELRENAFLGSHGVSSISKTDSTHFEVLDTDWSGGGAYTGDGPDLALIMYEKGYSEVAWDILKRHFWMGNSFIYYPQEHFCDRPMSPTHKRARDVSGLCAAEAILFGLVGFQPQYDGSLWISPRLVVDGKINIKGFVFRNNTFDVEISSQKMIVYCNSTKIYDGVAKMTKIL